MLAIYCRISKRKEDGKDVSIEVQQERGIKFAKSQKLTYEVFIDRGLSGALSEIEDRPAFAEMFKGIKKGAITGVYCIDQSRIERNSMIWGSFVYAMLKSKSLYYPNGVLFNLDDPTNRFLSGMISLANELYARTTSINVKNAINLNAKKGKAHGMTAFGYEKDDKGYLKVNTAEAKIVKRIYNLSLKGNGAYTIANTLNEEGIPTKFNRFKGVIKRKEQYTGRIKEFSKTAVIWRGNVIRDMICNPIYKGERSWNNEIIKVPLIVEEALWDKVNNGLVKHKAGKKAEYRYLLNGLINCGNCGADYRGKLRLKGHDNAYKCVNKFSTKNKCNNSRSISIPKLDTLIYKLLINSGEFKKVLKSLPTKSDSNKSLLIAKLSTLKQDADLVEKKLDKLYTILVDEELNDDERLKNDYKKAQKDKTIINEQIKVVKTKIDEIDSIENERKKLSKTKLSVDSPDFDNLKRLIHSNLEGITIFHQKQKVGGEFLVTVRFLDYTGQFALTSNWTASNWKWIAAKNRMNFSLSDEELITFN